MVGLYLGSQIGSIFLRPGMPIVRKVGLLHDNFLPQAQKWPKFKRQNYASQFLAVLESAPNAANRWERRLSLLDVARLPQVSMQRAKQPKSPSPNNLKTKITEGICGCFFRKEHPSLTSYGDLCVGPQWINMETTPRWSNQDPSIRRSCRRPGELKKVLTKQGVTEYS